MKEVHAKFLRNIALVGHGGDGKTTLAEAFLFAAGAVDRMGRVEDGSVTTDYDPEEIKRGISISSAVAPLEWKDHKITFIDIPGYFDFAGEMPGPLAVADGALVVASAVSGVSVGTEKALDYCLKHKVPRAVVINAMDRENADFDKVFDALKERYPSVNFAPMMLPVVSGGAFKGYTVPSTGKSYEFTGKKGETKEVPTDAAQQGRIDELIEALTEAAAGEDDALMEKFFDEGSLAPEELAKGLAEGTAAGDITPVFCSAAVPCLGVANIMDFLLELFPSPLEKGAAIGKKPGGEEIRREPSESAPFSALVFKTMADPFVGKISLLKVLSGSLSSDTSFVTVSIDKPIKAGGVSIMRGKKLTTVDKLIAGDIGVLTKLQSVVTGDTLCAPGEAFSYDFPEFPRPSLSMAVFPKNKGDEDKIFSSLHRLMEEDPSFVISKDAETAETIISGQGEMHLDVLTHKAASKFGVACELSDPRLPYRETIKKSIKAEGRHKKQTGGHGQFGHCWIEFEPIFEGPEFEFVDKVVGGVVPRSFIPAVEKGLRENLPRGVIAGYPLVNIRATLYDGSYHPVDSSEMAFKTAARLALKKCVDASPILLEPVYKLEVHVPDEYMGDVIGDMNRRRGRIMGMDQEDGGQKVTAEAPLSEVFKYATDLRAMTQARGYFDKEFVRYEEVPANIAQKIIANAKLEDDEE
ncbi:MAG: elongation factor G [Christensenellaceae bacterium]|jgi:elongation factor G|nr:elongation factor G [Christensenellaceae bacterium]